MRGEVWECKMVIGLINIYRVLTAFWTEEWGCCKLTLTLLRAQRASM